MRRLHDDKTKFRIAKTNKTRRKEQRLVYQATCRKNQQDSPQRATLGLQATCRKNQQDSAQRATLGPPSNMSQKPTGLTAKSNAWSTKQHVAKTNRTHRKEQRLVHQATCRKNQQDSPQRATLGLPSNMSQKPTGLTAKSNAWSYQATCRKNQQDSPQRATLGLPSNMSQKSTGLTAKSNAWSTKQHVAKTNRLGTKSNAWSTKQHVAKTNRTQRKEQRLVYQAACRKNQQDSPQRATLGLPSNMSQKSTGLTAKSNAWSTKQHVAKTNRTHRKEQRLVLPSNMSQKPTGLTAKSNAWSYQATCRKNQQDSPQRATLGLPSNMSQKSTDSPQRLVYQATCRKNQQDSPQRATLGLPSNMSQKPTGLTAKSNAWSTKQHVAKTNRTHRKEQRLVYQATCRKNQQDSPQRATLGLPSNMSQKPTGLTAKSNAWSPSNTSQKPTGLTAKSNAWSTKQHVAKTNRTHRKEQRLVYQATCRKNQQDSAQRATPSNTRKNQQDSPQRATLVYQATRRKNQQDSPQRATLGPPSNMSQKPTGLTAKSNAWSTKQHVAKTNRTHRKEQRLVYQATCRKNQQDSPQRATLGLPSNTSQKPTGLTAKSNAWSTKQHVAKTNRTHRKEQRLVYQATCRKNQQDSPQRATLGLPSNTSQKPTGLTAKSNAWSTKQHVAKTNRTHRKEQRLVYQATCRKNQQDSPQRATLGLPSNMSQKPTGLTAKSNAWSTKQHVAKTNRTQRKEQLLVNEAI